MDSGRRAVDSYWRSRMIDAATSDEEKVTPVYKLEEICDLLRSSHVSIVKEVSDFILKRLEHKSPVVMQKALRLIKYAVVKSGVDFKKEMQRNSAAIRQLFHYKGQPDRLKGDALNKAVRDSAHETISTIFSADDNKPLPSENLNKRIEGFGNTNYEMPSQDKKTFLSEVVGLGSASIKQGLSSFTQAHSFTKTDRGNYKGPNLQRSLTTETEDGDRYEPVAYSNEVKSQSYVGVSKNMKSVDWNQDSRAHKIDFTSAESSSSFSGSKTREERLLETIANSGGVRLQPTRDAIQSFLVEAEKLDPLALCRAIELKLKSPSWQVRMKAVCVLESIVKKYEDGHFSVVVSYFSDNQQTVVQCAESPQASLREKANKVLYILNGDQAGPGNSSEMSLNSSTVNKIQMPDLIDTGGSDGTSGVTEYTNNENGQTGSNSKSPTSLVDDLFGDGSTGGIDSTEPKVNDDPFSDVSFHTNGSIAQLDDIFSDLNVDGKANVSESHLAGIKSETQVYDIFGSNSELPQPPHVGTDFDSLISGLSVADGASKMTERGNSPMAASETSVSDATRLPGFHASKDVFNGIFSPQISEMNANTMFPSAMPYNISPGMILNSAYASQPINGPMSSLFAQQQFLATMSNLQHFRNLNPQINGTSHISGAGGGYSSPIPDIFQSNFSAQNPSMMIMNGPKKEETKAFDFISDHFAAARVSKR